MSILGWLARTHPVVDTWREQTVATLFRRLCNRRPVQRISYLEHTARRQHVARSPLLAPHDAPAPAGFRPRSWPPSRSASGPTRRCSRWSTPCCSSRFRSRAESASWRSSIENVAQGQERIPISYSDYLEYREQASTFERLEASANTNVAISDEGNPPEPYRMSRVTPGFFEMLGVQPVVGRGLTPADAAAGADPVILLSHERVARPVRTVAGCGGPHRASRERAGDDHRRHAGGLRVSEQPTTVDAARRHCGAARSIAAQPHADREAPAGSIEGAGPCGSRRDRAAAGGGVSGQRGPRREGSHVSRAAKRRTHPHRVHPDAGRRGLRAAHCLRQRGQHDAEPRAGPRAGDVDPRGDGRLALADGPATAAWKPCCSVSSEERPV